MQKDLKKIQRIINQAEIARRLNLSKSYVCLLFSGKRKSEQQITRIRELIASELSKPDSAKQKQEKGER